MNKYVLNYVIVSLVLIVSLLSSNSSLGDPQSPKIRNQPAVQLALPEFKVLKQDVYDSSIKTQIKLDILVYGKISAEGLKQLLNNLYQKYSQKTGFRFHNSPTHIAIYAYTSKEMFESGMGQWIAMLLKIGEKGQLQININSSQLKQLTAKPETISGLSEGQRKNIWREIIFAERKAEKEAERKYQLDPIKAGQIITLKSQVNIIKNYTKISEAVSGINLPAGTKIQVIKTKSDGGWKWCFIKVNGTDVSGWTTSVNLADQVQDSKALLEKQGDYEQKLMEKYRKEVATKNGLTENQISDIRVEGLKKGWPFPK